jgi:2,4-dienoyl-CoA reductase-like NADH-dependent reductase (Old Yellow Enzyme family)
MIILKYPIILYQSGLSMTLFDPGFIGGLELRNRFVRSATGELAAKTNGTITSFYFPLFENLAKGEVGLIIGGDLYVLDEGKISNRLTGISHDYHIAGHKQLTQTVHEACTGSKIAAQLSHGGAHSASINHTERYEKLYVQQLGEDDIEELIIGFRDAAIRAKKAGYDVIQLHAAHGYIINQFLSKRTNLRTDSWGGSLENRAQLFLSIFLEVRNAVGTKIPIIVKINGSDDPFDGFTVEESTKALGMLADEGLDAIEVSGMEPARSLKKENEGYFAKNAKKIHNQLEDIPIILVGGLRTFSVMNTLYNEFVDFVSMCRPFIREPDLVQKFKAGKKKADCISCNRCNKAPDIIGCLVIKDKPRSRAMSARA